MNGATAAGDARYPSLELQGRLTHAQTAAHRSAGSTESEFAPLTCANEQKVAVGDQLKSKVRALTMTLSLAKLVCHVGCYSFPPSRAH